jgi:hypothetical protein
MALPLTISTELESVNAMLRYVDEQPVNALPTSGVEPASVARQLLHEVSRETQSMALECNTEVIEIIPDNNQEVLVPDNYLRIDPVRSNLLYVQRSGKLYDKRNNTFLLPGKFDAEIVVFLPFEDLPEIVRKYITVRAARIFVRQITGETDLDGITKVDEDYAKSNMLQQEINVGDHNFLQSRDMLPAVVRTIQPYIP